MIEPMVTALNECGLSQYVDQAQVCLDALRMDRPAAEAHLLEAAKMKKGHIRKYCDLMAKALEGAAATNATGKGFAFVCFKYAAYLDAEGFWASEQAAKPFWHSAGENEPRRGSAPTMVRDGQKVSLLEVEEAVGRVTGVAACLAFAAPNEAVAVAVALQSEVPTMTLDELSMGAKAASLSDEWLPQVLVVVDAVPSATEAKGVWRRALGLQEVLDALPTEARAGEPTNSAPKCNLSRAELLEAVVAAVRQFTFNNDIMGDTLFASTNMDSLSATQVGQELEKLTGIVMDPTVIFTFDTPDAIAEHLHTRLAA